MAATRKSTTRRKTTARKTTTTRGSQYVVTGKFTLKSAPVSATKADQLAKKIRANGGTATKRKVN